jgi:NADPH:quinone reductase-like Zn-dependent oxidoreductase
VASTMHAVRLVGGGGVDDLVVEEVEIPELADGHALVRVHAAAITRDELEWPLDRLPAIPSSELSGVVSAVAPGVTSVAVGDEVYSLVPFDRDGAAAEYVAVPAASLAPKPRTLTHVESAAIPMGGLSAWQALFDHGRLRAGERVLVTGPAGGVGHVGVQLAANAGARVVDPARDGTAVEPVDLVFDTAGGDTLARSAELLRSGGRLVSIAEEPPASLRADIAAGYFVVEPNAEQLRELARLGEAGKLRVEIDSIFPLHAAREAFARVQQRGKHGKVVLQVHE